MDVPSDDSIRRVQRVIRDLGMQLGITGMTVDLVPLTIDDAEISANILGMSHNRFDGRVWDHHLRVQKYLPELYFGATLTHEIIHSWLARKGCNRTMSPSQEEGVCELFANLWLRNYKPGPAVDRWESTTNRRTDKYGRGYRWAVDRYGLSDAPLIQHKILTDFPS